MGGARWDREEEGESGSEGAGRILTSHEKNLGARYGLGGEGEVSNSRAGNVLSCDPKMGIGSLNTAKHGATLLLVAALLLKVG